MIRLLTWFVIGLFITGCATGPRYDQIEVKDKEIVRVKVPDHLTQPCKTQKPMAKEEYMKLKPHEREQYLAGYSEFLLTSLKDCNIDKEKIRKLNSDPK